MDLKNGLRAPVACALAITFFLAATGCGQKGPLYLPQENASGKPVEEECPDKRCRAERPRNQTIDSQ